jgi:hypothetical protein
MHTHEPQVIDTVVTAYRDVARVLTSMPQLVFLTLLILTVCNVGEQIVASASLRRTLTGDLISFASELVSTFLVTPFLIAVHRFILLGEVTAGYRLEPGHPRLLRFFGWSVALSAIIFIPTFLLRAVSSESVGNSGLLLVFAIVAFYLSARFTILFPAIAVDAPGAADYRRAFFDTRGHAWRIILMVLLALLPFAVLTAVVALNGWLPEQADQRTGPAMIVAAFIAGLYHLVVGTLLVAIASRLFQAFADRVLQPPDGSLTLHP